MITQEDLLETKHTTEEFLTKMSLSDFAVETKDGSQAEDGKINEVLDVFIQVKEPQFLIGQAGQTLVEMERVLRIILNKKLGKRFYLRVDINEYRKKKVEYIRTLAKEVADQVSLTQQPKTLAPMSASERRIVHMELSARHDVVGESQGEGLMKAITITPKQ